MKSNKLTKADRKLGITRLVMLSIELHNAIPGAISTDSTDAELASIKYPLHTCYQLFPVLQPHKFRSTVKLITPSAEQLCLAEQLMDPCYN